MNLFKKVSIATLSTVMFASVITSNIFAEEATTTTVINGQSLPTVSSITVNDFSNVLLDGTAKTARANLNSFTVTDATGTGNGWNVTMMLSQDFTNADGEVLRHSGLYLNPLTVEASTGSTSASEIEVLSQKTKIDANAQSIVSTDVNGEGMGVFTVSSDINNASAFELDILPSAYASTYTGKITVEISQKTLAPVPAM